MQQYVIFNVMKEYCIPKEEEVECVSVLHGTCLQCAEFFLSISMCSHVCQKILSTHCIP